MASYSVLQLYLLHLTLLDFLQHFHGYCNILNGTYKRWVVGKDGQPEIDYSFHKDTDSSAVSSLSDRNAYSLQHSLRWLLACAAAAVWHHTYPCYNATHHLHRLCNAYSCFNRVRKNQL